LDKGRKAQDFKLLLLRFVSPSPAATYKKTASGKTKGGFLLPANLQGMSNSVLRRIFRRFMGNNIPTSHCEMW
jgi:hypothetical protein